MLSTLLKRSHILIKALIKSIKVSREDFFWTNASLRTKEGRRTFVNCMKNIPRNFRYQLNKIAELTPIKVSNEWSRIGKYKTKFFGIIDFSNIAEWWGVDIRHYKHKIHLHFHGDNVDKKIIDACLYTVNNYFEINSSVKKAIVPAFQENKPLRDFFKYCYNSFSRYESVRIFGAGEFKTVNLDNAVKKLNYPDINFNVENDNLTINIWYHFMSTCVDARGNALIVKMNEQLNILNFEFCTHLIN